MVDYQQEFIRFCLERQVLRFGSFTLKSGRQSPYFFNAGLFNTGTSLARLGRYYALAIQQARLEFDMIFGPAYKGIPLGCAVAIAMAETPGREVPVCFNRKEVKDHGEGGITFGAPLAGRVLIVDDVISAGTSVNESLAIIRDAGATPAAVAIALDRQEKGSGALSAVQEVERRHGLPVASVIRLEDLIEHLGRDPEAGERLASVRAYRQRYGV